MMMLLRLCVVMIVLGCGCNQAFVFQPESQVESQAHSLSLQEASQQGFSYHEVVIESADGTRISANVFLPCGEENQRLPAIIFCNSWVLEEHEYFVPALSLVDKGYIVLSYSSRGWGMSGGKVQVAGPGDIEDVTAVLDWLQDNTPVDMDNIGIGGISYGAGISLIALARDSRLKTAVSMSGWADLKNALYAGETPALIWSTILVGSGYLTGDMDPEIYEMYVKLLTHSDIETVETWAAERSPINYVDLINQRDAPVYLSNNFGDDLFRANETLRLYQRLQVPKMLDLNQGVHATAEIGGLAGLPNEIWDNVFAWFDHYLQNKPLPARERVRMQLKHQSTRDAFSDWPTPQVETTRLYLQPPGLLSNGDLAYEPEAYPQSYKIYSGSDSGASSGFPLVSPALDAHMRLPVLEWMPGLNRAHGIVYESMKQNQELAIRGVPKLHVRVTPSGAKLQMVAYLYDQDRLGVGRLITFGPLSQYDLQAGEAVNLSFELAATAYDVKAGRRLVLVVDTSDVLYEPPTLLPYSLRFHHDQPMQAFLELPHRK